MNNSWWSALKSVSSLSSRSKIVSTTTPHSYLFICGLVSLLSVQQIQGCHQMKDRSSGSHTEQRIWEHPCACYSGHIPNGSLFEDLCDNCWLLLLSDEFLTLICISSHSDNHPRYFLKIWVVKLVLSCLFINALGNESLHLLTALYIFHYSYLCQRTPYTICLLANCTFDFSGQRVLGNWG